MRRERDERVKQVLVAAAILTAVLGLFLGLRYAGTLPGIAGEYFAMIAGVLSTPVFMEVSFFTLGLIIVLALNHWRMKRDGDEFVYLDELPLEAEREKHDGPRA